MAIASVGRRGVLSTESNQTIESLLIVRLSAMGDVIHTLPAAGALRAAFPQAMIGWLIEERWAELLCGPAAPRRGPRSSQRPVADWVHTVRLREWRRSLLTLHGAQQIAKVWNDVRSVHYHVAVDLQGAMRSAALAHWSGAGVVWGAAQPREAPASVWYTRQAMPRGVHVVEQNFAIAEAVAQRRLTIPRAEIPSDGAAERRIAYQLAQAGVHDFAILNPGAGWGAKCWPVERYGRVAKALAREGVRCVVNFGPGEEALAGEVETASGGTCRAMKCSITELIALTRGARLFIGGDTGPMHLAAALQIPVVAIFGPTDPARNGPYGTRSIVLRNSASLTTHARLEQPEEGLLEISVEAVVDAARQLLGASGGQPCPPHTDGAHG